MLLEIKNLYGGYGKEDIVKGVTAHADAGEILCLVGPNGCGKTTLFRLILGALKATSGQVIIDGKDTSQLSQKELAKLIAYIPQYHVPIYEYTVLEIVLMGRASHFSAFDQPSATDREAAFNALEKINAVHLANEKYTDLSGGQRQLILIARAICQEAKIFVMDEPAANLDYANHQLLMDVILDLAKKGYLVVMSTHSPEHPASIGSKVLMMRAGKVASFGPPQEVITSENLEKVYGVEMDVATFSDRYGIKRTICFPVKKPKEEKIHALIVGSIGVGKSTLINKVVKKTGKKIAGYRTKKYADTTWEGYLNPLFFHPVNEEPNFNKENMLSYSRENGSMVRLAGAFDKHADEIVGEVDSNSIIVFDEMGYIEVEEKQWCDANLKVFDGDVPVIAAVKNKEGIAYLDAITSHPKCKVFEITEKNRDELVDEVVEFIMRGQR